VNISLDTLSEATFKQLSRREGLDRVLAGIQAALKFRSKIGIRLNALILRDVNRDDIIQLVDFARQRDLLIRFIEFMPLDANRSWSQKNMVSGEELRQLLQEHFGRLVQCSGTDASQPSRDYAFADGSRVGFIDSVTQPFCGQCDRLRVTADGKIRNCLFGQREWDLVPVLRPQGDSASLNQATAQLDQLFGNCLAAKEYAHGISQSGFTPPERAMYQIGG
jgi:cyclic pyranopterin phosphate synthase